MLIFKFLQKQRCYLCKYKLHEDVTTVPARICVQLMFQKDGPDLLSQKSLIYSNWLIILSFFLSLSLMFQFTCNALLFFHHPQPLLSKFKIAGEKVQSFRVKNKDIFQMPRKEKDYCTLMLIPCLL